MSAITSFDPTSQTAQAYRTLCLLLSSQSDSPTGMGSLTPADWEVLRQIAEVEGVASLLYSRQMRRLDGGGNLPATVKRSLERRYYMNAAFNAMLGRALDQILDILTQAGIPVILLKGAALFRTLYADPAERSMNDLDLLVRRVDIPRAVRALSAAGYRRLADNFIRYHVLLLGGQGGRVTLELHWSLVFNAERYPALIDWFWQQARPLSAENPLVRVLSPTAHLLYLAVHLALQHRGEAHLGWYYDLALLLERVSQGAPEDGLDWDELLRRAGSVGWADALLRALRETQGCFASPLPDGLLEQLAQQAQDETDQASRLVGGSADHPALNVYKIWGGLSRRDRLYMLRGLLLPRPVYLRWRYQPRPAWLWPLCYFHRWRDLLVDGVNTAV